MATWGQRRQLLIIGAVVLVLLVSAGATAAFFLYKPAMCTDGKQNGKETGIDCGGPCPYQCTIGLTQPTVRFATAFSPQQGRTDVIAYIDNKNQNAGVAHVQYTLELRSSDGSLVAQKTGTVNLPPASVVPLFIPRVYQGSNVVTQAFVQLDPNSLKWPRVFNQQIAPVPSSIEIVGVNSNTPKVSAVLSNPIAYPMYNQTVVATLFDAQDNAVAASQTVVPMLPAQGNTSVVFTWNTAFRSVPVRVEILPSTGS